MKILMSQVRLSMRENEKWHHSPLGLATSDNSFSISIKCSWLYIHSCCILPDVNSPPSLTKIFGFMEFRLLKNVFPSQKFTISSRQNSPLPPQSQVNRCEAGETLTQTGGDTRPDTRFAFNRSRNTSLLQNLELKLYWVEWQETVLFNTTDFNRFQPKLAY